MKVHIFTYGSLMFEPVWSRVVTGHYQSLEAQLQGFRRCKINNESYPALLPGADHELVKGRLYLDIHEQDSTLLDLFEGDLYQRESIECQSLAGELIPAHVYVFKQNYRHMINEQAWDPEWFEKTGMHGFMKKYAGLKYNPFQTAPDK